MFTDFLKDKFSQQLRGVGLVLVVGSLLTLGGCFVPPPGGVIYEDADVYRDPQPGVVIIDSRPLPGPGIYRPRLLPPPRYRGDVRRDYRRPSPSRFEGRRPDPRPDNRRPDNRSDNRPDNRPDTRPDNRARTPVIPNKPERRSREAPSPRQYQKPGGPPSLSREGESD